VTIGKIGDSHQFDVFEVGYIGKLVLIKLVAVTDFARLPIFNHDKNSETGEMSRVAQAESCGLIGRTPEICIDLQHETCRDYLPTLIFGMSSVKSQSSIGTLYFTLS
jgi:hypothetical protein